MKRFYRTTRGLDQSSGPPKQRYAAAMMFAAAAFMGADALGQCTRAFVDADVSAGNDDGTTWANAYDDLQEALTANPVCGEIWVAAGTYKPTSRTYP